MHRQIVVRVWPDAMVMLAALPVGIDVDHHASQMRGAVEQLVSHIASDIMALRTDKPVGTVTLMSACKRWPIHRACVRHVFHLRNVCGMHDLVQRVGLDPVQHAQQHWPS